VVGHSNLNSSRLGRGLVGVDINASASKSMCVARNRTNELLGLMTQLRFSVLAQASRHQSATMTHWESAGFAFCALFLAKQ
jgi:hypothetical protein